MALINCSECDKRISDKAFACPNCGAPLDNQENLDTPTIIAVKNRSIAILLALFGGGFGLHKFYLIDQYGTLISVILLDVHSSNW
ncbi:MAG: TM2 domain-containing protein [Deinococcales bacterium]